MPQELQCSIVAVEQPERPTSDEKDGGHLQDREPDADNVDDSAGRTRRHRSELADREVHNPALQPVTDVAEDERRRKHADEHEESRLDRKDLSRGRRHVEEQRRADPRERGKPAVQAPDLGVVLLGSGLR